MYANTLVIAVPAKSSLHGKFMSCLMTVLNSNIREVLQMNIDFKLYMGKSNIVHARSIMLTDWYDRSKDGDLFLFIDSDHTFTDRDIVAAVNLQNADVACGIYCNSFGKPNAYMMDINAFLNNSRDNRMIYAGTGFMLIRRSICKKIVEWIIENDGGERFHIDDNNSDVIPFFRTRLIDPEYHIQPKHKKHWLGEDYSFCYLVRLCGGTIRGFISTTLGHEVLQVKHFVPENYKSTTWAKGSIVYICGMSLIPFDPTQKDLGGSEKAVVELCKQWVDDPRVTSVTVYGNVNKGVYDGVTYLPSSEFDITAQYDRVVLWRNYGLSILPSLKANTICIDLHDIPSYNIVSPDVIKFKAKHVFVKSMFHRKQLHPNIPDGQICIVPNGIEKSVLDVARKITDLSTGRVPTRFIYASSYMRGLEKILRYCWPTIRKLVPEAELHCYYGMQISTPEEKEMFTQLFAETEGVFEHGRISIQELIKEKQKATFHMYLTNTPSEIDCLTIRESALLGCIPLLTREGVFTERQGMFFDMVRSSVPKGPVEEVEIKSYQKIATDIAALIKKPEKIKAIRKSVRDTSLKNEPSWAEISNAWINVMFNNAGR